MYKINICESTSTGEITYLKRSIFLTVLIHIVFAMIVYPYVYNNIFIVKNEVAIKYALSFPLKLYSKSESVQKISNLQRNRDNFDKKTYKKVSEIHHLYELGLNKKITESLSDDNSNGLSGNGVTTYSSHLALTSIRDLNQEEMNLVFYKKIWNKINQNIDYPKPFLEQGIEGKVVVSFKLNNKGQFRGDKINISANSEILKTLVLVILKQALRDPIERHLWRSENEIQINACFDFKVLGYGQTASINDIPAVLNNNLIFKVAKFSEPVLNRRLEQVFKDKVPPVILLPGFVYIDFYRAFKYFENMGRLSAHDIEMQSFQMTTKSLETQSGK